MPYVRGSWYSQLPAFGWFDREDRPGSNALGVPDWQQGIALPSRSTLGKWFNVTPPGQSIPYPMQQTDTGPAWWTGRGVDISAAGAHQMGYTPQNFPTNASFKIEPREEPRALGSPAGPPVQAGDLPDNAVDDGVYARARNMPTNSLMDLMTGNARPVDMQGQPTDWGNALAQRSNSLIGLGMGLLQPTNPYAGVNAATNALRGYAQGAQLDEAQAQDAWKRQQANVTDFQKAARDLGLQPGSPQYVQFAKEFYAPKTEQWQTGSYEDARTEQKYPYRQHQRTGEVQWLFGAPPGMGGATVNPQPGGGGGGTTTPNPPNPPDPFTTGTPGVGYTSPAAPFGVSPKPPAPGPTPDPNAPPPAVAQAGGPYRIGPKAQEFAHNVRKEINALPEVKRIGEAMPIYRSMLESHGKNTRAADLDFVYGVAKIFDPDSVVREGEMKLVGQARTIPEEIQGWMSKVVVDKAALPPEVRARILEVAAIRMNQLNESYKQRLEPYRRQLEQSNLDPGTIMPQMLDLPQVKPGGAPTAAKIPTYNLKTGTFD